MAHPPSKRRAGSGPRRALLALLAAPLAPACAGPDAEEASSALAADFAAAAREAGVPPRLLLSVSYNLTRWDHHGGAPSAGGGYGLMHLTSVPGAAEPALHTLEEAASLLGVEPASLKRDRRQNLRGGAALLAARARALAVPEGAAAEDYYGAVLRLSGAEGPAARAFADAVYGTLRSGAERSIGGEAVVLGPAATLLPPPAPASLSGPAECPEGVDCDVVPAGYAETPARGGYGNYDLASRPADGVSIRYIIIHDTETSYAGTLRIFQDPNTHASAHYVVRSADGHIAQMVATKDVAWHAGNWYINAHSIGIEHEGVAIEGASWYGEVFYQASARLTRYLAQRFDIPIDRAHIFGHDNVPGPTPTNQAGMHWDPGPFWDWDHYMELLGEAPPAPPPARGGGAPEPDVVAIRPPFADNKPPMTYCYATGMPACRDVPLQPASFVPLRRAPSEDAPMINNRYIGSDPSRANNWGSKAVAGQRFHVLGRAGDWTGIDYDGQGAWFYDPPLRPGSAHRRNSVPAAGALVAPRADRPSIPVYGRAYPEAAAFGMGPPNPQSVIPIDTLRPGQVYVAMDLVRSDYYWAPTFAPDDSTHLLVRGADSYYLIFYNHRMGYVREADVERLR